MHVLIESNITRMTLEEKHYLIKLLFSMDAIELFMFCVICYCLSLYP